MTTNTSGTNVLKRAHYWVLGAMVTLTLVLLNLPPLAAGRLRTGIRSLFLPLFGVAGAGQSFVDRASFSALTRASLITEIERLRITNQWLQVAADQGQDALTENARLRAMIGWQPRAPWKLRAARVIAREPTTWWRTATVDFGARDGARPDQPVLTSAGLVGRLREVEPTQSQVALIGDPECGVSVVVSETRDPGIIQESSSAPDPDGFVVLRTLQRSPATMAGHRVVTSGLGGVFPAGIPVGEIVDTRSVDGGLFTEARVRLGANLNQLEEVWVVVP
ncbi:MAG: rod shape-determining protein MreC [Verrucomicrobiae bacterium]|nr:rod shape-determining protein MreC [Verrucomicrobiae bacterium]